MRLVVGFSLVFMSTSTAQAGYFVDDGIPDNTCEQAYHNAIVGARSACGGYCPDRWERHWNAHRQDEIRMGRPPMCRLSFKDYVASLSGGTKQGAPKSTESKQPNSEAQQGRARVNVPEKALRDSAQPKSPPISQADFNVAQRQVESDQSLDPWSGESIQSLPGHQSGVTSISSSSKLKCRQIRSDGRNCIEQDGDIVVRKYETYTTYQVWAKNYCSDGYAKATATKKNGGSQTFNVFPGKRLEFICTDNIRTRPDLNCGGWIGVVPGGC